MDSAVDLLNCVIDECTFFSTWDTHLDLDHAGKVFTEAGLLPSIVGKTTEPWVEAKLALYSDCILTRLGNDFPKLSPYWQQRILNFYIDIYSEAGSRPDILDRIERIHESFSSIAKCAYEPLYTTFVDHPRVTLCIEREIQKIGLDQFLFHIAATLGEAAWPALLLWIDPDRQNIKRTCDELSIQDMREILELNLRVFDLKTIVAHWLCKVGFAKRLENQCFKLITIEQLIEAFNFDSANESFKSINSSIETIEHRVSMLCLYKAINDPNYQEALKQLDKETVNTIIKHDFLPLREMARLGWADSKRKNQFIERDFNI